MLNNLISSDKRNTILDSIYKGQVLRDLKEKKKKKKKTIRACFFFIILQFFIQLHNFVEKHDSFKT